MLALELWLVSSDSAAHRAHHVGRDQYYLAGLATRMQFFTSLVYVLLGGLYTSAEVGIGPFWLDFIMWAKILLFCGLRQALIKFVVECLQLVGGWLTWVDDVAGLTIDHCFDILVDIWDFFVAWGGEQLWIALIVVHHVWQVLVWRRMPSCSGASWRLIIGIPKWQLCLIFSTTVVDLTGEKRTRFFNQLGWGILRWKVITWRVSEAMGCDILVRPVHYLWKLTTRYPGRIVILLLDFCLEALFIYFFTTFRQPKLG